MAESFVGPVCQWVKNIYVFNISEGLALNNNFNFNFNIRLFPSLIWNHQLLETAYL